MSVREYIGARYVPEFGRRGETSIAWDNDAPYEPLTIVQYQGNSYTSRQYVPAGLGAPNNNPNYWALTGNYNAQIEAYRNEVQTYSDRISGMEDIVEQVPAVEEALENETAARVQADTALQNNLNTAVKNVGRTTLKNSHIVTIGDSFATGSYGNGWPYFLRQYSGCASLSNFSINAGGFIVAGSNNNDEWAVGAVFNDAVTYAASHLTSCTPEEVDFVVISGQNDRGQAIETLGPAITTCMQNAATRFPNAQIWYITQLSGFAFFEATPEQREAWSRKYTQMCEAAEKGGAHVVENAWHWLMPFGDATSLGDGTHVTNAGLQIIARNMVGVLGGGRVDVNSLVYNDGDEGFAWGANHIASSIYNSLRVAIKNDVAYISGAIVVDPAGTSGNIPLFTLPKFARPVGTRYTMCHYYQQGGVQGVGRLYITSSGGVNFDRCYDSDSTTPPSSGNELRIYIQPITIPLGGMW